MGIRTVILDMVPLRCTHHSWHMGNYTAVAGGGYQVVNEAAVKEACFHTAHVQGNT